MSVQELVKELEIESGEWGKNDRYLYKMADSNEYSVLFSKLENSELKQVQSDTDIDMTESTIVYSNDDIECTLMADYKNDIYKLYIEKVPNE